MARLVCFGDERPTFSKSPWEERCYCGEDRSPYEDFCSNCGRDKWGRTRAEIRDHYR